ncbi:hypothetical protein FHETE_5165 [Fusarium heterosporum]|uniref:Protein ECM13 n=1 Tax=Fusarium heterosporum TaxID=42747 RepID=A0A8H5WSX1_FUSHE|nr:hypothetical protein FHETE_5165 [Fusarium heterosporum]
MSTTTTTTTSIQRPTASNTSSLRQSTLKKNMSITQTYYLAHKARAKLSREAAQSDHDLRLLVGHANLLDSLMLELADAEREQERWFNQSVRGATTTTPQSERRVQWADNVVEEDEAEYDSDSSDSDDYDSEDEDVEMISTPAKAMSPRITHIELEDDMEEDDLEEDYAQLELVRTPSHSSSPPELVDYDSDSSEDDSMPPSPPQPILSFNEKDVKEQSQQQESNSLYAEEYYLPARNPARLVSAISVY